MGWRLIKMQQELNNFIKMDASEPMSMEHMFEIYKKSKEEENKFRKLYSILKFW